MTLLKLLTVLADIAPPEETLQISNVSIVGVMLVSALIALIVAAVIVIAILLILHAKKKHKGSKRG